MYSQLEGDITLFCTTAKPFTIIFKKIVDQIIEIKDEQGEFQKKNRLTTVVPFLIK